jgi:hypothetical protein
MSTGPSKDIGYKVRMSYKRPRDALRGLDLEKDWHGIKGHYL